MRAYFMLAISWANAIRANLPLTHRRWQAESAPLMTTAAGASVTAGVSHLNERGGMWDVAEIRRRLADKATADPGLTKFGADIHRYDLAAPLTPDHVEGFESRYGVRLPDSYREFLLTVGDGGAGPGYGIYNLDGPAMQQPHIDDWCRLDGFLATPFPHQAYWNDNADDDYEDPWQAAGALPIGTLGCTMDMVLVVTGAARGQVWMDDRGADGGLTPQSDFQTWYLEWLG
ncbi:SMI1/KNR4 family protein [Actinoplanes sp. NEAU-A12]|uniref:SMI1/KNR4 family protein n=1 Tax=Actinoplanes sandaracinus TaxID=3045177 RepID=A0ABT6WBB7_9ACTN|nr:SMI1/KNR4 family protein [Actinoplanes sandaracinus]MDI6096999.1 SMI1/KNR4 family protein [Actinoplanes sandaracinus]